LKMNFISISSFILLLAQCSFVFGRVQTHHPLYTRNRSIQESPLTRDELELEFDCSTQPDGNYAHPTKCATHFVSCLNKQLTERACAARDFAGGYCGCEIPTTTSTTTTTTTPAPVGECNPDECQLRGECQCYETCNKETSRWESVECNGNETTGDLFWNPDLNSIHGGSCDYYDNLSPAVQELYNKDPNCIPPCDWYQKPEDECSPRYTYRAQFNNQTTAGRESDLTCPQPPSDDLEPLYWNQQKLGCDKRSRVHKLDGVTPCPIN